MKSPSIHLTKSFLLIFVISMLSTSCDVLQDLSTSSTTSIIENFSWSEINIPGQTTKQAPVIAEYNGKLYMVHSGELTKDIYFSSYDGKSWTGDELILGQTTAHTPALAVYDGKLFMVHTGEASANLYYSYFDGHDWTDDELIPGQTTNQATWFILVN